MALDEMRSADGVDPDDDDFDDDFGGDQQSCASSVIVPVSQSQQSHPQISQRQKDSPELLDDVQRQMVAQKKMRSDQ